MGGTYRRILRTVPATRDLGPAIDTNPTLSQHSDHPPEVPPGPYPFGYPRGACRCATRAGTGSSLVTHRRPASRLWSSMRPVCRLRRWWVGSLRRWRKGTRSRATRSGATGSCLTGRPAGAWRRCPSEAERRGRSPVSGPGRWRPVARVSVGSGARAGAAAARRRGRSWRPGRGATHRRQRPTGFVAPPGKWSRTSTFSDFRGEPEAAGSMARSDHEGPRTCPHARLPPAHPAAGLAGGMAGRGAADGPGGHPTVIRWWPAGHLMAAGWPPRRAVVSAVRPLEVPSGGGG